jgi:zinc/manganese transport system substrate-binding protein/manganese/iron transport system substrate-binding protein
MIALAPTARRRALAGLAGGLLLTVAPRLAPAVAGQAATPTPEAHIVVAASTPVFADIVANVGGDRVAVWSVIPAGADPHTWEASPQEVVRLEDSDSFIYMGAYLEPFIEDGAWRRAARDAGIPQLELAEEVELIAVDRVIDHGDHVHDLRGGDPHVWLDPLKAIEVVDAVETHLADLDPAGAAAFAANAEVYRTKLRALDEAYRAGLAAIPPERRKLVVFHDAYTYFAERYDFEVVGIVLPNPDGEPSARDIADLVSTIEEEGVGVVFGEPQFDTSLLDAIAAEAGVEVGMLMTDTFDGVIDTYLELMAFNLDSLDRHLAP